jgi:glycerol-3-phosphate dehydrogenase
MNYSYDVAVIGAGVTGTAIAHRLSRYDISTVLLERECDISFGVSKANSGIIHAGFHHKHETLKSSLEVKGNMMYDHLRNELHFPFRRCGVIVAAFSVEQMKTVQQLYDRGVENGVPDIELCGRERILSIEKKLNHDVVGGLFAPTGGIIEPYRFIFAMAENAVKNGVKIITGFNVSSADFSRGVYTIYSDRGNSVTAKYVINAAGLHADDISRLFGAEEFTIKPRKGSYMLFERDHPACPDRVVFPVPTPISKGSLVIPTVEGTMMVGPTATDIDDKNDLSTENADLEEVFSNAHRMVYGMTKRGLITSFSGLRPAIEGSDDFYIAQSEKAENFIQVAGIQSPGLTAAPAVAVYVKDILKRMGLVLSEKRETFSNIDDKLHARHMTPEKLDSVIRNDPDYGTIVCRCEMISKAEILEAIRHGHTTVDGIKFYTRAGMGRCQGGFCSYRIMEIVERETGLSPFEISKRGPGSEIVKGSIGDYAVKAPNGGTDGDN